MIESFREKNGGLGSIQLIQEQIKARVSTRICDLAPHNSREEKQVLRVKAATSDEIERLESEFKTTGIPLKGKEKAQPSNRRRKLRVYFSPALLKLTDSGNETKNSRIHR